VKLNVWAACSVGPIAIEKYGFEILIGKGCIDTAVDDVEGLSEKVSVIFALHGPLYWFFENCGSKYFCVPPALFSHVDIIP
jgi:hypothetical protein